MQKFAPLKFKLLTIALGYVLGAQIGWGASLSAILDRTAVPVGETVTFSLIFQGGGPQAAPGLPNIPNLAFQGVSQSTSITIDGGQRTSQQTYSYILAATQPGDITIPSIQVHVGGQLLASQPLKLKITPGATAAPMTNLAFLRLVVPKTNVYVGEAVPVEMQLYYRNVDGVQMPQLKAEGFSVGQSAEPVQTQTQVGGVPFNLVVFKTSATAARAGTLKLGPVQCSLNLLVPVQRRDPFDPFGFFGASHQRRPTTLQSDPVQMQVLPLPSDNVPPTFNGAVGAFNMAVTAAPTNVAVGDPITVKVSISGRGRLDSLSLTNHGQEWRDFNTYTPTKKVESSDPLGLSGNAAFEQVVIPQNHEIRLLPPVAFSFFDPAQKQYRTLKGPAIPLAIRSASVVTVPPPVPTNATASTEPQQADDILHIRPQFAAGSVSALLIRQPWFLGLQAVPVLTWLALLITRKRRESLANNPRLRRQREVARRIRAGIKELHVLVATQDSDAFFATLFRLLQEQIGERLDLPASAITEAIVDECLRQANLSPETLAELEQLFLMCNQARYAPQKTRQELSAIIPRAEAVLRDLKKLTV